MTDAVRRRMADRLRAAREDAGLSQEEVATHLGLPRPAISQIENANRRVEALELARLARLYRRPLGFFADEDPPESPRLEALHRAAAALSKTDREEVLRFAEFLRQKSGPGKKRQ